MPAAATAMAAARAYLKASDSIRRNIGTPIVKVKEFNHA